MSVGRREFIIATLGSAAAAQLLGCGDDADRDTVDLTLFAHGVASGDPLVDSVILWTRVNEPGAASVEVEWLVSRDPELGTVLYRGFVTTTADLDFTVKVDVVSVLQPGTTYYYAFRVGNRRSLVGRTRTLPMQADRARIAVTSCANYQNGYFNVYGAIAKRLDLDLWVHLGDYIYEYKAGEYADPNLTATRSHLPANEAVTLQDYRTRYAQYRSDPDLQLLHRQHPLVVVWDDHEFANNAYVDGAQNHNAGEGDWNDRKRAASRAYLEWLPIRATAADPVPKIFRTFKFGNLFDLIMLDTRMIARAKQAGDDDLSVGDPAVWREPTRQLLGTEQEAWFLNELAISRERSARWRLVGNQVIISQARDPRSPTVMGDPSMTRSILYSDFWDGYQPARDRVFNYLLEGGVQNVVFLTGDIHTSWAFEVSKDPFDPAVYNPAEGRKAFAIELVGPSVTSLALEGSELETAAPLLLPSANPHLKYVEVTRKGYVLVDLSQERMQAEWWYVKQYKVPNDATEELAKAFTCQQSTATLVAATEPSPPKDAPAPAPTPMV